MSNTRLLDRAVLRLSPKDDAEDVRDFLQGLVTQDSALVAPGVPLWAGLLTPQGKALFDFMLFADPQAPLDILIDCEADQAAALRKRLMLYRLRRKINIELDEALGVFWTSETYAAQDTVRPEPVEGQVGQSASTSSARTEFGLDPRLPALGQRWIAPITPADSDASADYRAHRLSLGVTEGVAELGDAQTLWLEANAIELNGVSFTKGCYVGQENTARMNWRAKINRRMVVVPLDMADAKRQRVAYSDLGLSVEHRRVEDMMALDLPEWQAAALVGEEDAL